MVFAKRRSRGLLAVFLSALLSCNRSRATADRAPEIQRTKYRVGSRRSSLLHSVAGHDRDFVFAQRRLLALVHAVGWLCLGSALPAALDPGAITTLDLFLSRRTKRDSRADTASANRTGAKRAGHLCGLGSAVLDLVWRIRVGKDLRLSRVPKGSGNPGRRCLLLPMSANSDLAPSHFHSGVVPGSPEAAGYLVFDSLRCGSVHRTPGDPKTIGYGRS